DRCGEHFLCRVLGDVDVAEHIGQHGHRPPLLLAKDTLDLDWHAAPAPPSAPRQRETSSTRRGCQPAAAKDRRLAPSCVTKPAAQVCQLAVSFAEVDSRTLT